MFHIKNPKKKKNTKEVRKGREESPFPRFSRGVIFLMHTSDFSVYPFISPLLMGSEAMIGNLQRISRHSGLSNERPSTSYFCPQKAYPSALFHAQWLPFWQDYASLHWQDLVTEFSCFQLLHQQVWLPFILKIGFSKLAFISNKSVFFFFKPHLPFIQDIYLYISIYIDMKYEVKYEISHSVVSDSL